MSTVCGTVDVTMPHLIHEQAYSSHVVVDLAVIEEVNPGSFCDALSEQMAWAGDNDKISCARDYIIATPKVAVDVTASLGAALKPVACPSSVHLHELRTSAWAVGQP